jgi:membrane fusion protein, heavy metal efflux system
VMYELTLSWRRRIWTSVRALVLLISALAVLSACGAKEPAAGDTSSAAGAVSTTPAAPTKSTDTSRIVTLSAAQVQHGAVRWTPVASQEGASRIEVPGQLVPNEDRTARIGAPLQSRVVAVHVQSGSRVARGQALVTLQSAEANAARAEYAKAVADLAAKRAAAAYARSARERNERLFAAKAAPRQDVERSQADDALAQSELASAQAEVSRTRATLSSLGVSTSGGSVVLRSPLDGVVLTREAVPGTVVAPGAPLVTVSDASSLWLDMSVPAASAPALTIGSRVRFGVPAFPTDTFEARVVSIAGSLDTATRALPVRAAVTSTRNRLRAAMFATVWLDAGARTQSVAVPTKAIMLLDGRPVAFVATPLAQGAVRLERRDVVTGGDQGGITRLLDGVKPGELVVTDGAFAVKATFSRGKMPSGG